MQVDTFPSTPRPTATADRLSPAPARSYRDRLAAAIQPYRPADRAELSSFLAGIHGPRSHEARPDYLDWLAEGPPAHRGAPHQWVYRDGGRIVGRQAAIPVTLAVGRHTLDGAWAVHLVVEPAHQLRGIGTVLTDHCFAGHPIVLGLEVSESARRAYRRAGWVDLGTVPLFVRVLDPVRALARKWPERRWLRRAGTLARVPLAMAEMVLELRASGRPVAIEEIDRFDSSIDVLFDRVGRTYPVVVRRDSATLNWRFADYPAPHGYRRLLFRHGGELVGYAVLRLEASASPVTGHIVDWFCAPTWTWYVLGRCLALLRRWGAALAYCITLGPAGERALRQLGFIERDSGRPLMYRAAELPHGAAAVLSQRRSWFVTAGDSDVDRPRRHTIYPRELRWDTAAPADRARRPG